MLSAILSGLTISAANPGVTLIGIGFISGTALDKSGLDGTSICQRENSTVCIDQATMGGFGSAVAFTGHGHVFVAVPDRGPFDGRTDVSYLDRFHFLQMTVDMAAPFPNIRTTLLDTRFLKGHGGDQGIGHLKGRREIDVLVQLAGSELVPVLVTALITAP